MYVRVRCSLGHLFCFRVCPGRKALVVGEIGIVVALLLFYSGVLLCVFWCLTRGGLAQIVSYVHQMYESSKQVPGRVVESSLLGWLQMLAIGFSK